VFYGEGLTNLIKEIKELVTVVENRTVDKTPSIPLLLSRLLSINSNDQLSMEEVERILTISIEEIDRRNYDKEAELLPGKKIINQVLPDFTTIVQNIIVGLEDHDQEEDEKET
jgi:hypothetical protein